jgi:hypothetical protein
MLLRTRTRPGSSRRKGNVVVVVAVSLVAILSFTALALDGGQLMDKRRQAQSVSDSAALAAAGNLYVNWWANGVAEEGLDPTGSARAAALAEASANGYVDGVNGCTVTVNIPPLSGPFAGQPCHVEVIISAVQPQYFSKIFGTTTVPYGSRSVARGRRGGISNAIITLDPSGKGSLNTGGNGTITVKGAPVQVNSNDPEAMISNGGASMSAQQFLVAGSPGWATPGGGTLTGPIVSGSPPIPDPLANLPYPDPAAMTVQSTKGINNAGNKTLNLQPGVYQGGITATGGTVNMAPGVYYMQGGGFKIGGQANLNGTGVMIFNDPQSNSDVLSIAGSGSIVLSPPLTGPYQGVLLFQNRSATAPVSVTGSAGTTMTITGTFYAAAATLAVSGNGNQQTIGSQYISYDLSLTGNGSYYCSWTPDLTPGIRELKLVE